VARPAMWKANSQARAAGFGRRHTAARRAAQASRAVASTEARIDAIYADGAPVKEQLDAVEADAHRLYNVAHPPEVLSHFEDYDHRQLNGLDRQIHAVDTYSEWAHGQPVAVDELAEAVMSLSDMARQAPRTSFNRNEITWAEWVELLQPVIEHLHARGVEFREEPQREVPELGLGL